MIAVRDLYNFIDKLAPFENAMDFDNVGVLVGDMNAQVKNVLLALDINKNVIDEAVQIHADIIISHHPVIFKPIRSMDSSSVPYLLAKNQIVALCAHTNLDVAAQGVNYHLAKALSLDKIVPMSECGMTGETQNVFPSVREFACHVKEHLCANGVRFTDIDKTIKKVAVCSGSGGDFVKEAYELGADVLVTGEIKHSQIILANDLGIAIVDAGHFKTEDVVIEPLRKLLEQNFQSVTFAKSKSCSDKINFV